MVIYALPYAAGGASIYYELAQHLDKSVRFVPLELPGRGRRMGQPRVQSIQKMAADALRQIAASGLEEPYCLMGYSMGTTVCYELYQLLRLHRYPLPCHMIMCAADIPAHKQEFHNVRGMSDSDLIAQLRQLGGTPREILENSELLELVLPLVRDDFIAVEEYRPSIIMKMNCGGTVICSRREFEDEDNEVDKWKDYFAKEISLIRVEGGHFFLHDKPEVLAGYINRAVEAWEGTK